MDEAKGLAADADLILNNRAHREALERIEKEIVRKIAQTEFDGSEQVERYREKLNLLLHLHTRYKRMLISMIANGQIEAQMLDRKRFFSKGL